MVLATNKLNIVNWDYHKCKKRVAIESAMPSELSSLNSNLHLSQTIKSNKYLSSMIPFELHICLDRCNKLQCLFIC